MNERIKQLKHQASLWCDKNIPEQYSEETNGYGRAWEDKFAELIIRDVMAEVKDEVQYELDWALADIITERVYKTFGVRT